MRPVKLIMSAFGPYAEEECIDFTKLSDRNIFVITGPTGAGKTTIFDAICYALYGQASGSDRKQDQLRSDFAEDKVLTYVELEFEINNEKYYIKRMPSQRKIKERGTGFTEQKADAEFKSFKDNKIVTGINEVDKKVNDVLGINYRQFKQLVMLPQGEFKQLLLADSKDKGEILGKIFDTDIYLKFQNKLEEKAKKVFIEVDNYKKAKNTNIQNINYSTNDYLKELVSQAAINNIAVEKELSAFISKDKELKSTLNIELKKLEKAGDEFQKKFTLGEQLNSKFEVKKKIEEEINVLNEQKNMIEEIENKVTLARSADKLIGYEKSYELAIENKNKRQIDFEAAKDEIERYKVIYICEEKKLSQEKAKEEVREKLSNDIAINKGLFQKVNEYENSLNELKETEATLSKLVFNKNSKKTEVEKLKNNLKETKLKMEKIKNASVEALEIKVELDKKAALQKQLVKLLPHLSTLDDIRKEYQAVLNQNRILTKYFEEEKNKSENLQKSFLDGFAGRLALELKGSEPCPVCGSLTHPKPSKMHSGIPSEKELKIQEEKVKEEENKLKENSNRLAELKAEGNAKKSMVDSLKLELMEQLEDDIKILEKEKLTQYIKAKEREINLLITDLEIKYGIANKNKQEFLNLTEKQEEYSNKIEAEEKALEIFDEQYTKLFAEVQSESKIIDTLEKEISPEIRSKALLSKKIEDMEIQLNELQEKLKISEESYNNSKIKYNNSLNNKEIRENELKDSIKQLEITEKEFHNKLNEFNFNSIEQYLSSKLKDDTAHKYESIIKEHHEKFKSSTDRFMEISEQLQGKVKVDLDGLTNEINKNKAFKDEISKNISEIYSRIEQNEKIIKNINTLNESIEKKEKEYGIVGELRNIANGKNSQKLTFERYVLSAFFDEIIVASNIRFSKMTNYRYEMNRIKDKGKGASQSGLEIEVFDNYTGRFRHIKTLSGGESFKASLSLALGLSDVVEAYAGGIRLETMFVDEGFGTLDSESLDNAIQCLIELQNSGRLVGIISHVEELKNRIDAKLLIEPFSKGSKTKFIV